MTSTEYAEWWKNVILDHTGTYPPDTVRRGYVALGGAIGSDDRLTDIDAIHFTIQGKPGGEVEINGFERFPFEFPEGATIEHRDGRIVFGFEDEGSIQIGYDFDENPPVTGAERWRLDAAGLEISDYISDYVKGGSTDMVAQDVMAILIEFGLVIPIGSTFKGSIQPWYDLNPTADEVSAYREIAAMTNGRFSEYMNLCARRGEGDVVVLDDVELMHISVDKEPGLYSVRIAESGLASRIADERMDEGFAVPFEDAIAAFLDAHSGAIVAVAMILSLIAVLVLT